MSTLIHHRDQKFTQMRCLVKEIIWIPSTKTKAKDRDQLWDLSLRVKSYTTLIRAQVQWRNESTLKVKKSKGLILLLIVVVKIACSWKMISAIFQMTIQRWSCLNSQCLWPLQSRKVCIVGKRSAVPRQPNSKNPWTEEHQKRSMIVHYQRRTLQAYYREKMEVKSLHLVERPSLYKQQRNSTQGERTAKTPTSQQAS